MASRDELLSELPDLLRFARSIARDEDQAHDLVQETVIRALERADQYRSDGTLGAWLRTILRNQAIDRARKSIHELSVDQVETEWRDDELTVDPAVVVERSADREELEDALARLPFTYRMAVVLHDVEGWTTAEIAKFEKIGLPAAKQRLRRGRMMLVSALAGGALRRHALKGVPMRCWDARQHVSDYLNGSLAGELSEMVEAHLTVCPTCPPLYAALVGVRDQMNLIRDDDRVVPPDLAARIEQLLPEAGQLPTGRPVSPPPGLAS